MKFVVESVRNGGRLGLLSELANCGEKVVATPLCMLYTRAGSAHNLTANMLQKVPELPQVAHLTLPTLIDQYVALDEYQKGIKSFANMQDVVAYCSFQDSATNIPAGFNDKHGSSVWSKGGKTKLDVDLFMKCEAAIRPDIYQLMCDSDTDKNSGKKRLSKSVDRTLKFLDSCLTKHQESEELKGSGVFGSLVGGYSEIERVRCARETAKRPVDGFCVDGFHNYGPETEDFAFDDIKGLLQSTMAELPPDRPRVMHHVWTPDNVLRGISSGIDIFDSSYPYLVTERGGALTFDYSLPVVEHTDGAAVTNGLNTLTIQDEATSSTTNRPFEIDLKDKQYAEDFGPLVVGCCCYTCETHTRAYVNHLLNTSELLAGVLLTIHNVHHYSSFFVSIREALQADRFTELQQKINSYLS